MNRVKKMIHCEDIYKKNYYGQGVGVAILDTGICRHPDFSNRIVGFHDIVNKRTGIYDDSGHGTHVTGIIGGNGKSSDGLYMGVAPKCKLISIKVLDQKGNGNISDVLKGIDWIIQNRTKYNIRIINISVGMTPKQGDEEKIASLLDGVEYAWDMGLVVVTAAGNNGPGPKTITSPGESRYVITVGSCDDTRVARGGQKANYSSRGPTLSCICKPDIVAPGSSIMSCSHNYNNQTKRYYCRKSGTSMATPVVSGAMALLLSKFPDMSNLEAKMRLRECAADLGLPRNQQGWGMLDAARLVF